MTIRLCIGTLAFCLPVAIAGQVEPVPDSIEAEIVYIAGENLYIDVDTEAWPATSDTVFIGEPQGYRPVLVLSSRRNRSVLLPLTDGRHYVAGDRILIRYQKKLLAGATVPDTVFAVAKRPSILSVVNAAPVQQNPARVRITGTASFELATAHSRSIEFDVSSPQTFVTPTVALRAMMTHLPGGYRLQTGLRWSYRYSDAARFERPVALRLYEFSIVGATPVRGLLVTAGRFHNPYERYSGFWDGISLRASTATVTAGILAGLQPEEWNQEPGLNFPKASGFVHYQLRRRGVRYQTDLSIHYVHPAALETHTFAGWTQRLTSGKFGLSQTLQFDRNPTTSAWVASRFGLNGSVHILSWLTVYGRYGIRQPYSMWRGSNPFNDRRDEVAIGFSVQSQAIGCMLDLSRTSPSEGGHWNSAVGGINVDVGRFRPAVSGSLWQFGDIRSFSASPGLAYDVGSTRLRIGYRYYRTQFAGKEMAVQGPEWQSTHALGKRIDWIIDLRGQSGASRFSFAALTTLRVQL